MRHTAMMQAEQKIPPMATATSSNHQKWLPAETTDLHTLQVPPSVCVAPHWNMRYPPLCIASPQRALTIPSSGLERCFAVRATENVGWPHVMQWKSDESARRVTHCPLAMRHNSQSQSGVYPHVRHVPVKAATIVGTRSGPFTIAPSASSVAGLATFLGRRAVPQRRECFQDALLTKATRSGRGRIRNPATALFRRTQLGLSISLQLLSLR